MSLGCRGKVKELALDSTMHNTKLSPQSREAVGWSASGAMLLALSPSILCVSSNSHNLQNDPETAVFLWLYSQLY